MAAPLSRWDATSPLAAELPVPSLEPVPAAAVVSVPAGNVFEPATDNSARPVLPHRMPVDPDVPTSPTAVVDPPAKTPELARIATHLRRDDNPPEPRERPEGFDVDVVLDAVRGVTGVQGASLRTTAAGAHNLRLDLADGADAAHVSREVARLLQERLGLAAAPHAELPEVVGASIGRAARTAPSGVTAVPKPTPGPTGEPGVPASGIGRIPQQNRAERRPAHAASEPPPAPGSRRGRRRAASDDEPEVGAAGGATVPGPRPDERDRPGRGPQRVLIDHVRVTTSGQESTVEVSLSAGARTATGTATGPAVDAYVLRLCAVAAATAIGELVADARPDGEPGRCFVEHVTMVTFGACEVAVVVALLVCDGWVEQLSGSALVDGDPHHAAVRATMAAVNRLLDALL